MLLRARAAGCRATPPAHSGPIGRGGDPARPNLVLILTDDQRWDTLWAMPNVRRLLVRQGLTFRNSFVTTSYCCPSRASLLTGQYSRHTGVYSNSPPDGGAPVFRDRSTLATWLHSVGYTTGLVGKYLSNYQMLRPGYIPPGWDEWDAMNQVPMTKYYDYTLNQNGRLVDYGDCPRNYSTSVLGRKAVDFIRRAREPYFLYYAPIAPHLPATAARGEDTRRFGDLPPSRAPSFNEEDVSDKPWRGIYRTLDREASGTVMRDRQRMLASLQAVDRSVAAIVRTIAARGQLDNTVIAFTSDNGYLWGEHRLSGKVWPYEESIRVPLVFRVPGTPPGGRTDDHLALNIDLAATFADLGGARPGLPQDGRSLAPLLEAEGKDPRWRDAFVAEYLGHEHVFGMPPRFAALRTERYLYVRYTNGWVELYDLRSDPHQLENLAESPAFSKIRSSLARRLSAMLREPR